MKTRINWVKWRDSLNNEISRNISWSLFGSFGYAVCQWMILTIIAKLGTPSILGEYSLGLAITAPVIMFLNFQLRYLLATDTKNIFFVKTYFITRVFSSIIAFFLIFFIATCCSFSINTNYIIILLGLSKSIESISDISFGFFAKYDKFDLIAKSVILKGIISTLVFYFIMKKYHELIYACVSIVVTWGCILMLYDIKQMKKIINAKNINLTIEKLQYSECLKLICYSFPLGIVMMIMSVNFNLPKYFIKTMLSEKELGIYSALVYFSVVGLTVIRAISNSVNTKLAKVYNEKDIVKFKNLLINLIVFILFLGLICVLSSIVFGEKILAIFYTIEYSKSKNIFIMIMIASVFMFYSSLLESILVTTRNFKIQIVNHISKFIISGVFCWIFIKKFGIIIAPLSMLLGGILSSVIYTLVLLKTTKRLLLSGK